MVSVQEYLEDHEQAKNEAYDGDRFHGVPCCFLKGMKMQKGSLGGLSFFSLT
jgi:hypothetical protein